MFRRPRLSPTKMAELRCQGNVRIADNRASLKLSQRSVRLCEKWRQNCNVFISRDVEEIPSYSLTTRIWWKFLFDADSWFQYVFYHSLGEAGRLWFRSNSCAIASKTDFARKLKPVSASNHCHFRSKKRMTFSIFLDSSTYDSWSVLIYLIVLYIKP